MDSLSPDRFSAEHLLAFARDLLVRNGLAADRAADVAEVLLEGDLLGHTTHGLALLPLYLDELAAGRMLATGEPTIVADHGAALTWDGGYRPGPWLLRRALAEAQQRLREHPVVTVAIRRSHHLACLQAYLEPIARAGQLVVLTCSDPANRWVVPPGGVEARYSPDPIAAGIPATPDPILIDISLSTTSANACIRASRTGERLPGPWLVDAAGRPSDDPRPVVERREGGLYPLGGADLGYKGFALALLVEALTGGLAGHGRADADARWGSSVFLQLIDPARFGGTEALVRETSFLAHACRQTAVPPGAPPVRLPGQAALARRRDQLAHGVTLRADVLPALRPWAERHGLSLPTKVNPERHA